MLQPPSAALTFLLALFTGWVNRHQQRVIEYLVEENRDHQGLGNKLIEPGVDAAPTAGEVQRRDRLGGVFRYYYRAA